MTVPKTSRRLFLAAGSASAVFRALHAAAAQDVDDPIFAAIERHRAADAAFVAACDLTDEVCAELEGRTITAADEALFEAANDAERAALDRLFETAPITKAGALAVIAYLIEFECGASSENPMRLLESLARSPVLSS